MGRNQLNECDSVLGVVDRAFKLMFRLQLNYPEECKHLWDLIQFKFFHVKFYMGHTNCRRVFDTVER